MSVAKPVIALSNGGAVEIITDGVDGRLVPQDDAASLADAIVEVSSDEDLRHRMGTAARETYLKRFSASKMASSMASAYEEVLCDREGIESL